MSQEERALIQDLNKCDFGEIHAMHKAKVEARKNMTKEEKLVSFQGLLPILSATSLSYGRCQRSFVRVFFFSSTLSAGCQRGQSEDSG